MLKLISFILTLLLSFNADAIIMQNLSKTLSYDNIAGDSSSNNTDNNFNLPATVNKDKGTEQKVKNKKVDLTNKYSAKIELNQGDTVEITLNQDNSHSWVISPSSENLRLISNTSNSSSKTLKFEIGASDDENIYFIYFDYYNEQNNVEQNKQLTINVSK